MSYLITKSALPTRLKNGLAAMGLTYIYDLKEVTESAILREPNLGRGSLGILKAYMAARGIMFLGTQDAPRHEAAGKKLNDNDTFLENEEEYSRTIHTMLKVILPLTMTERVTIATYLLANDLERTEDPDALMGLFMQQVEFIRAAYREVGGADDQEGESK